MTRDLKAENLGYLLVDTAAAAPERVAIIDLHGGRARHISYGALDRRMTKVAAMLARRGLASGDRLILSCGNRAEYVEIMYGAMRAGIVPVTVNTRQSEAVLDYIVKDSGAKGAVVEVAASAAMAGIAERRGLSPVIVIDGPRSGWEDYEAALAAILEAFEPPRLTPDHMAFLAYTSGSTGRPKGVPLSHGGQIWWTRAATGYWPASPEMRTIAAMPLYHKNAMAGAIKPRLFTGGSVVLMPEFSPRDYLCALSEYRCTGASGVPTVFALLLDQRDLIEALDFSALKTIAVGSAPVHEELMNRIAEAFDATVMQSYGLTEGGPVMFGPPLDGRAMPYDSVGVPWPEGEVKLVSPDGEVSDSYGELWVRNPGVPEGYYNLPEVNKEKFVDGWLRTGDLFSRDDQDFYYFRGRSDDMFKCGGESVYPKEVENVLLSHPDVVEACVVPVEHKTKGVAPVAMVALRAGARFDEAALKQYCLERGPAFSHPRRVVVTDRIPLTGAGKIDRSGIRKDLNARFGPLESAR